MNDARLHNSFRTPVTTNQAPYRSNQASVTVVLRSETLRPRSNPFCLPFCYYFRPQTLELRTELATPLDAKPGMKPLLPVVIRFVQTLRSALLTLSHIGITNLGPRLHWVRNQITDRKRVL
jgi:hypothetical protein